MQTTVLFKAPGRRSNSPVVILQSVNLADESIILGTRLSRVLSAACQWVQCNCTPRNIFRALFCEKASMAVAVALVCAMWWRFVSIADTVAAGEQVATDCLFAMPWGIVWVIRATKDAIKMEKEGLL